jgi:hypothetical protein
VSNDSFQCDAIIESTVGSQTGRPAACAEGALKLLALTGPFSSTKHIQRVDVDPARHRSGAKSCAQTLAKQKGKIELGTIVSNQGNVNVLLHRHGCQPVIL